MAVGEVDIMEAIPEEYLKTVVFYVWMKRRMGLNNEYRKLLDFL
jgi:hypothetical protein